MEVIATKEIAMEVTSLKYTAQVVDTLKNLVGLAKVQILRKLIQNE
jgi:hypothetical protein